MSVFPGVPLWETLHSRQSPWPYQVVGNNKVPLRQVASVPFIFLWLRRAQGNKDREENTSISANRNWDKLETQERELNKIYDEQRKDSSLGDKAGKIVAETDKAKETPGVEWKTK